MFLLPKWELCVAFHTVCLAEKVLLNFFPCTLKFSFKTLLGHGTQHFHYEFSKTAQYLPLLSAQVADSLAVCGRDYEPLTDLISHYMEK